MALDAQSSRTPQGVRGLKHRGANTVNSRKSRTPQGVRGLKLEYGPARHARIAGRTPQGVRGLKRIWAGTRFTCPASHSARSAWIETYLPVGVLRRLAGRTPQGVRGLKHDKEYNPHYHWSVALRKECVD